MSKVLVAVPNLGSINTKTVEAIVGMLQEPAGHKLFLSFRCEKPIDSSRNRIIKDFLTTDCEYLLFLDEDNPPLKNPLPLVGLGLDILALPTPLWNNRQADFNVARFPIFWNCFDEISDEKGWTEHHPKDGLQEIHAAGTGCMIIHRRVLEKVKPAFARQWDEDGIAKKGSDLMFCKRAREHGFRVWAHYGYPCSHFKSRDLTEIYQLMRARDIQYALPTANRNTPDYWDQQWEKRGERVLPFYESIAERVGGKKVLDYGCGRGDLLALLGPNAVGCDISKAAVNVCKGRGLSATTDTKKCLEAGEWWDAIVCTEVLEHVDDDRGLIDKFFEVTDTVIYSVPHDCLPPGIEKEHRRVYPRWYVAQITPHLREIHEVGIWLVIVAERKRDNGKCDVPEGNSQLGERKHRLRRGHDQGNGHEVVVQDDPVGSEHRCVRLPE